MKEQFILLSKLQIPEINPRTLYRGRLVNLLFQNKDKKLISLFAGAGYGKTTLITHFIDQIKLPYVYYQLKNDDIDPSVFLSHLITGLKNIYPSFGENITKLSRFFNLPPAMFEVVLGTFINEVVKSVNNETYIIFDDYHSLGDSSVINGILSYLLENMPPKLHIILSSRTQLPFSLTSLKARDEIFEITTDLLRFTREEIQALFITLFNIKLQADEIDWLYKYSEGWPASIRLMLQAYEMKNEEEKRFFFKRLQEDFKNITKDIFDYFSYEVFGSETREYQQILIDCSLFDYLNPEICRVITQRKDAQKIVEELARRNAFIFPLADGNYRLHSLFQEFLRNHFTDEKRKKEIYHRIAEYFKDKNQEEALKYYLIAEDFVSAIKIIEMTADKMIKKGMYATLISTIEGLPELMRNRNPLILKYHAEAQSFLGNLDESYNILIRALKLSRGSPVLRANILYGLAGVLINQGNLKSAIKFLKRVIKFCPRSLPHLKASALNSLGAICNAVGGKRFFQAKKYFKNAYRIAEIHQFLELKTSILNNCGMSEYKLGNLNTAYRMISEAVRLLKDYFSIGCGAGFYNAAKIALLMGNKDDAKNILESGLNICQNFNDQWSMASIWRGYGLLYAENYDFTKSEEYYKKALGIYEKIKVPWLITNTLAEMCKLEIIKENYAEAEKIFQKIQELKKSIIDTEAPSILLIEAQLKMAYNEDAEAEAILDNALKLSKRYNLGLETFLTCLRLCSVTYRRKKWTEAEKILRNVIEIVKRKGYEYLFLKELRNEHGLVDFIINRKIKLPYFYSILRKYRIFHVINVSFFGLPTLEINGRRVSDQDWQTEKAKKLLFFMLLNKNAELSQESLIETFWQRAGLRQGYNSLRQAIHHIRKTLKNYDIDEPILTHSGFYQFSPDFYVISDVDAFEEIVNEYKKRGDLDNIQIQRLESIYKNGFARIWYDNWVIELGDKYQKIFEQIQTYWRLRSQ